LADRRDPRRRDVLRVLEGEPGSLVIPAPVTAEIGYLLRRRGTREAARAFLNDLADGRFIVESMTRAEHAAALRLHDEYRDLDLGLADLSVIVLARRHRTRRLLTFDERDFRQVIPLHGGTFRLLPLDQPPPA
jgi:predicted nucleic acid-binding protein